MTIAAASDLTALFVSVVPSFAGMGESVKSGGAEAAAGFTSGFADNFHPFQSAGPGLSEAAPMFAQMGGAAAGAFTDAFSSIMKGDMPNLMSGFDLAENVVTGFVDNTAGKIPIIGHMFTSVFDGMLGTLDAFKGPAGDFLNTLVDMGTQWQEWDRHLAATTLDLGQLPELKDILRDLGSEGLDNLNVAADAIGTLHARLSDLNPEQLKETTKAVASMSELFGDVKINTDDLTGVLNAFNVATDDTAATVNKLGNIAVASGTPVNELITSMGAGGAAALRGFGYGIDQAGTLLANLNKEGVKVPQFLSGAQMAASKFLKAGLTPEEGWGSLVEAVKDHLSNKDEAGAEELLRTYFPRNAPAMLEAFKKGLVELPNQTNALEGIDRPLDEANAKTATLHDAIGGIKVRLESMLQPLTEGMANGLTQAGDKLGTWISLHQGDIVTFVTKAIDTILHVTAEAAHVFGDIIIGVAPYLNVVKEAIVDVGQAMLQVVHAVTAVGSTLHIPGMKEANDAVSKMGWDLKAIGDVDFTKYAKTFGEGINHAADQIPKIQEGLHSFTDPLESSAHFSEALKQNITDAATGKEAVQDMFKATDTGQMQLIGTPEQMAESKQKLAQLGVEVTTGPDGIVTKVLTGNQKIKDDFTKWYEETTKKKLPIETEIKTQDVHSVDQIMDIAGVPKDFQGTKGVELPATIVAGPGQNPLANLFPPGAGVLPGGGGAAGNYGALGQMAGGGSAESWRPAVTDVVTTLAPRYGITNTQAWIDKLVTQIGTESGGNVNAINLTDSNAQKGTPSQGILQFIKSTYDAHNILSRPFLDPTGQIAAAIDYVMQRYGQNSQGVPNFIGEGHGYQSGGNVQVIPIDPAQKAAWRAGMYTKNVIPWIKPLQKQEGGFAELPTFGDMQQPIPGDWQPGQDSVHGVLEVGEYVVKRDKAQKHKQLLDGINFGDHHTGEKFAGGGQVGVQQVIWANPASGVEIGEAGGKLVGPGTGQSGYYASDWGGHHGHVHTSFFTAPDGSPYGMPIGTDIRQGAPGFPQWVYALGDQFGVEGSTYPGHQEKSGYNRGIDWWPKGHADMSGASYSDAERSTLDRFASAMASAGAPTAQVSGGHVTNDGTGEAPAAWGGGGGGSGQIFNASVSSAGGGGTGGLGSGGTGTGSGGALSGNYDTDRRNARLADMDQGIADKQKRVDEINGKIGDLTKDRDAKQADLDKLLALPAPQQKLQADDIQKARDKLAAAEKSLADTTGSLADAQGNVSKAQRDKALELEKPAAKGAEAGAGDSGAAQQLGQGLIKGMFQELGFPDVFGKPFTEWGIWKLAMGGMGYGMGLLQNMGGGTGTGTGTGTGSGGAAAGSGGGAAAGSGGGAGDFLSSLFGIKIPGLDTTDTTHAGTGAPPGPADIPNAMAPSEGPANVPVGAQGQGPGAPGVQIHVNNNGVTTPDQFKSSVNNAQVDGSRQTATVGAAPVPGNP